MLDHPTMKPRKRHLPSRRFAKAFGGLLVMTMVLGCEAKNLPSRSDFDALSRKAKEQMVSVQGGPFKMGDFGELHSGDGLPYSHQLDDGPLHEVTVPDFLISKYKVTLGDYDFYASATGRPLPYHGTDAAANAPELRAHAKSASFPAGVDWPDAKAYCQWLGRQTGMAMDLPTEAEWEYAARARGTLAVFATDNGKADAGRNFPTFAQAEAIGGMGSGDMPVGAYPSNPLGLYDMGMNGFEWTNDWYASDYYERSPSANPRGPEQGTRKVVRGGANGGARPAMTFQRRAREPLLKDSKMNVTNRTYGFRCVARSRPGS